ncbi:MAG: DUF1835 domain-containing protein [Pyrinomonadaceae bacterium]
MTIHVLPGDSLVDEFRKANIPGDVIVCRECLVVGPVDADTTFEFWDDRARFILAEYGEDEIEYHERVADELEKLAEVEPGTEVNLWFEYELFCSVNIWFCISKLAGRGANIYRVEPSVLSIKDRWKGFGALQASDLRKCFESRRELSADDIKLGAALWEAFRADDHRSLKELSKGPSDAYPYLDEVCEAAIEKDLRPVETLMEIKKEGITEFDDVFAEFSHRAGVYGLGDLQVQRLLERSGQNLER